MDTKKLAVFLDLAKTENYSRSAERMFLSQSTISKYIMALEKEWKTTLFVRAHRQVKLTSAGKAILPHVKIILQKESELNQLIDDQPWNKQTSLVIRGIASFPQYEAFHIITKFTKKYPDIKLKFNEARVDKLTHALDHKTNEIIYTRTFGENLSAYDTIDNEADKFVVLIPKNNPLADKKSITLEMLKDQSILLLKNSISQTNPLYTKFQNLGSQPHITYNGQRIELLLEMLNQGDGVSVVMNKSFDLTGFDNIKMVPLKPEVNSHLVFMKRHDNNSFVVNLFWDFATKETEKFMKNKNTNS